MRSLFFYTVIIFFCFGCNDSETIIGGPYSKIGFEKTNIETGPMDYKATIKSKTRSWDLLTYKEIVGNDTAFFYNQTVTISDDNHQDIIRYKDSIEGEWYIIKKNDQSTLTIELRENITGHDRSLEIHVGGVMLISETVKIKQKK